MSPYRLHWILLRGLADLAALALLWAAVTAVCVVVVG